MNNNSLRNQFIRDMQLKNYAEMTQQAYLGHVLRYVKHFRKSPLELGKEQIKQYLHTLVVQKRSQSYISQAYSALKFLYEVTMQREWDSYKIPRGRREKRLPHAFSQKEIIEFFNNIGNPKHRAIFELMYCGGLRVSEVVNLKIKDINSTDMSIFIRGGKGNKDRYTTLSNTALETIRNYFKLYRPTEYLFPGTVV